MASKEEIRSVIKFHALSGETPTNSLKKLKSVYGETSVCRTIVFEWHKRYSDGRVSLNDDERPGRPVSRKSLFAVDQVSQMLEKDRRYTLRELAAVTDLSVWRIHQILHKDLGMRKVCARWIPRILTDEKKQRRVELATDFLRQFRQKGDAFLNNIITADETWVYHFEPESKMQSSVWKHPASPPPKKARRSRSSLKRMFIIFFDVKGIVLSHGVPTGQTVNAAYYKQVETYFLKKLNYLHYSVTFILYINIEMQVLSHSVTLPNFRFQVIQKHLVRAVQRKRPDVTEITLHQDNAPCHRARVMSEVYERLNISLVDHPPYSPDLAPCDFALFPRLKSHLRGTHFTSEDDLTSAVNSFFGSLTDIDFRDIFIKWCERWQKCIDHHGEYFEKE